MTWLPEVPGVECRPCGRKWAYSFGSGKLYELEKVEKEIGIGTMTMWIPRANQ